MGHLVLIYNAVEKRSSIELIVHRVYIGFLKSYSVNLPYVPELFFLILVDSVTKFRSVLLKKPDQFYA